MAEGHLSGTCRHGPYSRTRDEIRAEQGRVRAASARQRTRAAWMRDQASERRAQRHRIRWLASSAEDNQP